jgi:hypothetical protein
MINIKSQVVGVLRGAKWKTLEEIETLRFSEKAGNIYPSTRRNIPEDASLQKTPTSEPQALQLIFGLAVLPSII